MLSAGGSSSSSRPSASSGPSGASSASSTAPEKSNTRLYVGNLHPSVDEYTLIQVYSKHGKVAKLDFLFHKSGPQKGKPRGFAFVEYATREEAMQALIATNDKMLRGRKLSVTFANKSDYAEGGGSSGVGGGGGGAGPHRNRQGDISKPTTLSLIKNAQKPKSTNAKIAAMEAKLKLLQEKKSSSDPEGSTGGRSNSVLPVPPSSAGLPSKPPPALPDFNRPAR